ncbi:MAG: tyrosine-protein phosphatase [Micromonosporaceae bacterium]|nr:tyrosine-protein phosphatase [Micromonosporaceae bacterium]
MDSPTFTTVFNFRDLGGHRTSTGRTVHFGRLYRSDSLHRLSTQDGERLASLGVRTVLDLRRPGEIARDGRVPESLGLAYHNIYPEHREWDPELYDPAAGAQRYLADRYLDMAEEGLVGLGAALQLIAEPVHAPVVIHCMAGKDRTGVLSALTLSLLGVPDADIAADYALSAAGQQRLAAMLRKEIPEQAAAIPDHFVRCPPQAMLLFLADLRQRYGSVAGYVAGAGVTDVHIAALRTHLLAG